MPKVYIKTYGCQMNEYDSAKLTALLQQEGYENTDRPEDADYIIVNTCSVRQNAEDRAIAFLSSHKPLGKKGKVLCLFGCTANLYGKKILKKYDFIDIVCGPNNYKNVPLIFKKGEKGCFTGDRENPFIDAPPFTENTISAAVTITKGCENFCSYCVVPFTRGKLISKRPERIYREIEELAEKGIQEVTLLGQNVNEYGKDINKTFTELLENIHNIETVSRIGFVTSHPKDVPDKLISLFAGLPKLYKHFHLPIQSGSNRILKMMNRRYTLERYKEIVQNAREAVPDISITSDIIVGYPNETEEDFSLTYEAVKEIEFDDLFVFKYSHRPGTAAAISRENDIPEQEKEKRHKLILDLQDKSSYRRNKTYLGKKCRVLVRNKSNKREGFSVGRTITNKPVFFKSGDAAGNPGKIIDLKVTDALRRYLVGEPCGEYK